MEVGASSIRSGTDGTGAANSLLWSSQIEFGCVLDALNHFLFGNSFFGGIVMRLNDFLEIDFIVFEKPAGGHCFGMTFASGGNTDVGTIAKASENFAESFVESFIVQFGGFEFVRDPVVAYETFCLALLFCFVISPCQTAYEVYQIFLNPPMSIPTCVERQDLPSRRPSFRSIIATRFRRSLKITNGMRRFVFQPAGPGAKRQLCEFS